MKINENSWHCHLASVYGSRDWNWNRPRNLCQYMRRVCYGIGTATGITLIASFLLASLLRVWMAPVFGADTNDLLFIVGSALHVTAFALALTFAIQEGLFTRAWRKVKPNRTPPTAGARDPNPFWQWIKDRHAKVCRMVTYVE